MERRDVLRPLASATALTILPHRTLAAWSRVASGLRPANGLTDPQLALVRAVGDTILPRTDTPGATDVEVHGFVDVMYAEHFTDEERTAFAAGLAALDGRAVAAGSVVFADLPADARALLLRDVESGSRDGEPASTYWRLKGLVVHGYFTSEQVMKDVLKHQVMPGRFDGSAPVVLKKRGGTGNGEAGPGAHHG